tara:strand:+ start:848 stop:1054 length:207 start_codon:yes stop_codon:yes gene_type:complete
MNDVLLTSVTSLSDQICRNIDDIEEQRRFGESQSDKLTLLLRRKNSKNVFEKIVLEWLQMGMDGERER